MSIVNTGRLCPICDSEIKEIHGAAVITPYCTNINCLYFGKPIIPKKWQEMMDSYA